MLALNDRRGSLPWLLVRALWVALFGLGQGCASLAGLDALEIVGKDASASETTGGTEGGAGTSGDAALEVEGDVAAAGSAGASGQAGAAGSGGGAEGGSGGAAASDSGVGGLAGTATNQDAGQGGLDAGEAGVDASTGGSAGAEAGSGGSGATSGFGGTGGFGGTTGFGGTSGFGGTGGAPPCSPNQPCPIGMFCELKECSSTNGTCAPRPTSCTNIEGPVCGCDGVTYWNDCYRQLNGISLSAAGGCSSSPWQFVKTCYSSIECSPGRCGYFSDPNDPCPPQKGVCWIVPAQCPASVPVAYQSCTGPEVCANRCSLLQLNAPGYPAPCAP